MTPQRLRQTEKMSFPSRIDRTVLVLRGTARLGERESHVLVRCFIEATVKHS